MWQQKCPKTVSLCWAGPNSCLSDLWRLGSPNTFQISFEMAVTSAPVSNLNGTSFNWQWDQWSHINAVLTFIFLYCGNCFEWGVDTIFLYCGNCFLTAHCAVVSFASMAVALCILCRALFPRVVFSSTTSAFLSCSWLFLRWISDEDNFRVSALLLAIASTLLEIMGVLPFAPYGVYCS